MWQVERMTDSLITIAGLVLLYHSRGTHGESEIAKEYLIALSEMATRMQLFGIDSRLSVTNFNILSPKQQSSAAHVAWGAFNVLA